MNKFLFTVGLILVIIGAFMKGQVVSWNEENVEKGNKTTSAITGAVAGVATGAGIGVAIGGIGIAACGTGVGLPVGAVCLGLASILGGGGAFIGHSVGKADLISTVLHTESMYPGWLCYAIIIIGVISLYISVKRHMQAK